ncbi:MAG: FCD domain-containing protein [Pseudomonadota bacterium]
MPFEPIAPEKLSHAVVKQMELLILRGILRPGERLPSERELAERLAVSRPSLRDAIATLEGKGLLTTKAGAGVYVAQVIGSAFSEGLVQLLGAHDDALFDYIAFRRDLEGLAAARVAELGSDTDLAVINTIFEKMEAAHSQRSSKVEAELDARFHMAIIEASHNIVMLHMMRAMFDLLQKGVFYNRQIMFKQRATRDVLLEQHRAINDALQARDKKQAQQAVHDHLTFVEATLAAHNKSQMHEDIAKRRLQHTQ